MRYDARIYPEDHEPCAIKINGKKHPKRKIFFTVLISLLIVASGALAFWKFSPYIYSLLPKKAVETETDISTETDIDKKTNTDKVKTKTNTKKTKTNTNTKSSTSLKTKSDINTNTNVTDTNVKTVTDVKTNTDKVKTKTDIAPKHVIPKNEWYMVLANASSPLSKDFTVETSSIDAQGHLVDKRIVNDLKSMLKDASNNGYNLSVVTGFRSYQKQESLYNAKVEEIIATGVDEKTAKTQASKSVMAPGTSDHNTGLGVDIVNSSTGDLSEENNSYKWLVEHSWEYGFILRYPKGKENITGQKFEPWHYRYVGKEEAKLIHESGMCLEEYLKQK